MKLFFYSIFLAILLQLTPFAYSQDPVPAVGVPGFGVVMNYFGPAATTLVPAYSLHTFQNIHGSHINLIRVLPDWQTIEKSVGVYDFTYPDLIMGQFQSAGLRPVVGLGLTNPLYGVNYRINTQPERVAFGNFVHAIVTRYAGRQVIWEVWNEPNTTNFWQRLPGETLTSAQAAAEYITMVQYIVPIIRAADPNALVIGPAAANVDTPWMFSALQAGLLSYFDGLSVHPYQPGNTPEQTIAQYNYMKTWIPTSQRQKPIFFSESGYSAGVGLNEVSLATQANYVVREYLIAILLGVPVNMNYALADTGRSGSDTCTLADHCYGWFTEYAATQKAVYLALKNLVGILSGYAFIQQVTNATTPSTTYVLKFVNPTTKKIQYAVWDATTTSSISVQLPSGKIVKATQTPQFFPSAI